MTILGELLSRGSSLGTAYMADEIEAAPLAAILEVKVNSSAQKSQTPVSFDSIFSFFFLLNVIVSIRSKRHWSPANRAARDSYW